MHGPTGDRLEELLTRGAPAPAAHFEECAAELGVMQEQAEWLRALRVTEEIEPAPGFYARVLQCIEERAKRSIWYGLVYSPMGKRMAYAALSLMLALGLYVVASEQQYSQAEPAMAREWSPEVSGAGSPDKQRDAVLVNLTSYAVPAETAQ